LNTTIEGKNGGKDIKINNLQALINKDYITAVDPSEVENADNSQGNYNIHVNRGDTQGKPKKVMVLNYNDYLNIINDEHLCKKMKDFKVETLIPPIWKIE